MPDTEISKLPPLTGAQLRGEDVLAIADVSLTETKKIRADDLVIAGLASVPDGSIDPNKLDWSALNSDSISGDDLADGSIADEKLIANTLTARSIAPNAIGSSELANGAVDTGAISQRAVTGAKVSLGTLDSTHIADGGIDTDALAASSVTINKLGLNNNELSGTILANNSVTAQQLAPNSVGASELANLSVNTNALQTDAVTGAKVAEGTLNSSHIRDSSLDTDTLQNGAVTINKLGLNSNELDGAVIQTGTIGTDQLTDNLPGDVIINKGIDTAQLADSAVTGNRLAAGAVSTSKINDAAVTNDKIADINGDKINNGTIEAIKFNADTFGRGLNNDDTNVGITNVVTAATSSGISWNSHGLITGATSLAGTDLPVATDSSIGGISVPAGSGLSVSGAGAIDHTASITAGTVSGITFDEHGHITATEAISPTDLPPATSTRLGAVSVPTTNNNPLTINSAGELRHANVNTTPLTNLVSVNVDVYGHVSSGNSTLVPDQIPSLDASIINTGQFPSDRIADDAITRGKLANYSISFIQEAEPTNLNGVHAGMFWYQESTGQLRVYNLNSWMPVGFGRLAQDNLRFCGTINADTGFVTTLTDNGRTAGFVVGNALPTAADQLSGTYLVVDTAGSNINVVSSTSFDEGDWVLCIDDAGGWIRIDTAAGGGGGGALLRLNDLLDVDINSPQAGDGLFYDPGTNNWTNRTTATSRISIIETFDGSRTSFTLSDTVTTVNTTLLVLSGVLQEPGIDYQIADGTNVLNFSSPPAAGSDYYMLTQYVDTGGGGGGGGGTTLPPGTAAGEYLQWNNTLSSWMPSTELSGGTF